MAPDCTQKSRPQTSRSERQCPVGAKICLNRIYPFWGMRSMLGAGRPPAKRSGARAPPSQWHDETLR